MVTTVDWDFHQSANALVKALSQSANPSGGTSTLPSTSSPVELTSWFIEDNNDGTIYLAHPPVVFRSNDYKSHQIDDDMTIGEDEVDSSLGNVELDESTATVHNCNSSHVTEWTFSVVFHETWRVPTLYFHVHDIDGSPITRDDVLTILLGGTRGNTTGTNANGSMTEEETWDFVSQEEHPMTGKPSFFLHPCQTAAKMELLLHQPKHYCPLLSWMSMILPSVGCTISPYVYHEAQKKMMNR